jgi:predicted RNase H-like HicB family nuclease
VPYVPDFAGIFTVGDTLDAVNIREAIDLYLDEARKNRHGNTDAQNNVSTVGYKLPDGVL